MNLDNWWLNALWSIVPTICIGLTFWFIIFSIIRADRSERRAYSRIEAEERARFALESAVQRDVLHQLSKIERPVPASQRGVALQRPPAGFPFSGRGSGPSSAEQHPKRKGGVADV